MDRTWAAFWKVFIMPAPAPRWSAGREFMTAARLGEANIPIDRPIATGQGEPDVAEVDRQQLEHHETRRRAEHPSGGEGAGAVTVRQDPRKGPAMRKPTVSGIM